MATMTKQNDVAGMTRPMNEGAALETERDELKKNRDDLTSVLETEGGTTILHNDVVAKIAGMALREVEGVYSLAPYGAGQVLTRLTHRVSGRQMRDLGVHVDVGKIEAAVDARIIVKYGHSIINTANAIRERITDRISQMTGLRVVEVNVEVVDLHFPPDEPDKGNRVR